MTGAGLPSIVSIRVVGLPGSLREGSYTRQAVRLALEGAREAGAETELLDLREMELPFAKDPRGETDDGERLRATVRRANGLVLGTPEYHGGYSGVLKNALDLMGFDELEGKMIGLVAVSGGATAGISAMNTLRDVSRAVHAWVVPKQAGVPAAHRQFDDEGRLRDDGLAKRLRGVGQQVAQFAALHSARDCQQFLAAWERAPENPGG